VTALRRIAVALLSVLALGGLAACGGEDAESIRDDLEARADEVRERARAARERLTERIRQALEDLEQAVPRATPATQVPESAGRTEQNEIERFLTDVIQSVDRYWTRTLTAAGRDEPRVAYVWVPPGNAVRSACGATAGDDAAFYCPTDDTIYFSQQLAADLWRGIADQFPGERAGYGNAVGDFGVAYVVAHEYAHNVQQELGIFTLNANVSAEPFELQADCMAGLWGNSVFREGRVQEGDVEEALSTAAAAGDFDELNPGHHGTPDERRQAWLLGYESGDPAVCRRFTPT
jgi:predicted metalloprotease